MSPSNETDYLGTNYGRALNSDPQTRDAKLHTRI